ncbi:MAG TPA: CPBP family intramembrane metalloprotease [Bacteroidales bacterium]|nr:CPBP family intramembrane metalloprotease [Bacteroidales bacterium]
MNNIQRLIFGLAITLIIFAIASIAGRIFSLESIFFPDSVITHSVMLTFSVAVIISLKKMVPFRIAWPRFKTILKPIFFGLLTAIVINLLLTALTLATGGKAEAHPLLETSSPLQTFLFVFIYASIAEEVLLRGFLQNVLTPLNVRGIRFFRIRLSLPVIISAVVFGLIHLILLTSGVSGLFVIRVVIFTTVLGLFAGYYQEKYDNFAHAVIVHMAGNIMGLVAALVSSS